MKTDPQHMLPAHLPFYKRRWFWIIILSVQFLVNVIIFHSLFNDPQTPYGYYKIILSLFGAVTFDASIKIFFTGLENYTQFLTTVTFSAVFLFLIYKTFVNREVPLPYPVLIFINSLVSSTILSLFFLL
jgi:hypothetical protein